jgi:tripartite-type tricarboxylate transporter receptor subunit TctC
MLAVTSARPSALLPGLPTIAASGVPGYEAVSSYGLFAPVRTPAAIVNRLHDEIVRVLTRPEVKDRLAGEGAEVIGDTPDEFAVKIKAEMASMGKVIRDAGVHSS